MEGNQEGYHGLGLWVADLILATSFFWWPMVASDYHLGTRTITRVFFVYGGSIITAFSHIMLYWADVNKLTSNIFKRGQGESTGTHWAKAGLMGIVLPVFNFIGLIVMSTMVGQDWKTFALGILVFITYLLGNTLLLLKKGKKSESEEHELRDNNPPADNSPAANLSVDNSSGDNSTADNAVVDNSPAANSSIDNSPAANSPVDNSSVDYSPANSSLQLSICTLP